MIGLRVEREVIRVKTKHKRHLPHIGLLPNDPYMPAGKDSRNGDIKIMDKDGNIKYIRKNPYTVDTTKRFLPRAKR